MTDTAWVVGAALGGAAVGGLASACGSLWVSRRAVIRDARFHVYENILPELLDQLEHGHAIAMRQFNDRSGWGPKYATPERERPPLDDVVAALRRTTALLGHRERTLVETFFRSSDDLTECDRMLGVELQAWRDEHESSATDFKPRTELVERQDRLKAERIESLRKLSDYLGAKIL